MIEVFDRDGCLTDDALLALIRQEPDEMTRLEIAEHLSFCDRCTERYSELLCEARCGLPPSLSPIRSWKPSRGVCGSSSSTAILRPGMAACLALTFWFTGVFEPKAEPAGITAPFTRFQNRLPANHRSSDGNLQTVFRVSLIDFPA